MKRSTIVGALAALLGMFPAAFVLALVWKFPLFMVGYQSGFEAALFTPFTVFFFGILGGFLIVPALGALAGQIAFRTAHGNASMAHRLSILFGMLSAFLAGVLLILLDQIFGPF